MKLKPLLHLLFLALPIGLTAQKISGQIINEFDDNPVFGVTIYSNGLPFAFSDQEGKFEIENTTQIKELTFTHLAFTEKTVKITEFQKDFQIVYLTEKATLLNEIEVTNTKNALSLKDIIKKSTETFNKNYKTAPYLTKVNAKQIVLENSEHLGYLEIDGILYNFVPKEKNPFLYPYILPQEFRKNIEKLNPKDYILKSKEMFNHFSADHLRGSFFLNFQSVNLSHPLNKKHKYTYKRLDDIEIEGKTYYQIQFFQKKGIHIKRDLFNVYGEMLICKNDFSIFKHNVSFDFDNFTSNEFEIVYDKKNDAILPAKIISNIKLISTKIKKKNTLFQTHLTIDNSKTINQKELKLGFQNCYYLDEVDYSPQYWQQKKHTPTTQLIDNYLKTITAQDFINGAKQKQLNTKSKYYKKSDEEFRLQQIKKHTEALKNIPL